VVAESAALIHKTLPFPLSILGTAASQGVWGCGRRRHRQIISFLALGQFAALAATCKPAPFNARLKAVLQTKFADFHPVAEPGTISFVEVARGIDFPSLFTPPAGILLVPQGDHRIDPGRTVSGKESGQDRNQDQEQRRPQEYPRIGSANANQQA
jgi:hypothetical protein